MRVVSWNVNGLRSAAEKGFFGFLESDRPDFLAVQETKMRPEQADFVLPPGYRAVWHSAERKGYSGTAVFTRHPPLAVSRGPGNGHADPEGRFLALEYPAFHLVCCYAPNSRPGLARIGFRLAWEDAVRARLQELDREKPVIFCGDLNVARTPADLKNPRENEGNAGYSEPERGKLEELLASGFSDTFRILHPDRTGAYTWWSYRSRARERNAGWRIDYVLCSDRLIPSLRDAGILSGVPGSDHCPVSAVFGDPGAGSAAGFSRAPDLVPRKETG